MKKALHLLLAGALAAGLLSGCGSAFEDSSATTAAGDSAAGTTAAAGAEAGTTEAGGNGIKPAKADNVLRISEKDQIPTLDTQKDTEYYVVPLNIYDRLIECDTVDGKATLIPGLAKSWDISDDGLTYTFHLNEGVKFHNGETLEADDVVFTIDRMMNPDTQALSTDAYSMIKGAKARFEGTADGVEGVKAIDPLTVEITLDEPFAPFLANLATPACSIYNREAVEAAGDKYGIEPELTVGTGPFKVTGWVLNDRITLTRNDDYFKGPAALDGMEIIQVPDDQTQKLMYESGELDVVDISGSTSQLDYFLKDERYKNNIIRGTEAGVYFYMLNMNMKPMDDVRVRKALQMSIDRKSILEQMYSGEGVVVNSLLPGGFSGSYEAAEIPYDPEQAKELLKEAGYEDGCDLTIYQTTDNASALAINQVVQAMLEQVGFKVTINQMDEAALLATRREGGMGMLRASWKADFNDPDNFLYTFFSRKNSVTRSNNYNRDDIFDSLEKARTITDEAERMQIYKDADTAIVQEDAMIIPLFQMNHIVVAQDWVKGFHVSWNGWSDTMYYGVSMEK